MCHIWPSTWISNHIPRKSVGWFTTYHIPNFNGCVVEFWEAISSFIPHFIYNGCSYLSMLGFKLKHVSKGGHLCLGTYYLPFHFNGCYHIQLRQLIFCFVVLSITTKTSKFRIYKIKQTRGHLLCDSHYTPLSLLFSYKKKSNTYNRVFRIWIHWPMVDVNNSKSVIPIHMLRLKSMNIYFEIALRWMLHNTYDEMSTLVWVMAWCRQALSHHVNQC